LLFVIGFSVALAELSQLSRDPRLHALRHSPHSKCAVAHR
jgi:hypothetical protein